jgi:hypothetical protein
MVTSSVMIATDEAASGATLVLAQLRAKEFYTTLPSQPHPFTVASGFPIVRMEGA